MASKNIIAKGTTYNGVESVTFPVSGGGDATFYEVSDTTAGASDVASGKYFYTSSGVKTEGTASGGSANIQSLSITQNGTYTASGGVDGYSPVTVSVSGGGGLTLLYTGEVSASTTSTSTKAVETLQTGVTFETGKEYVVSVFDKAGKRNGYFYRCDTYFFIQGTFANSTLSGVICIGINSDGTYNWGTTVRGVYCSRYYGGASMGDIVISSRYDSSRGTVDGTYTVNVYEVCAV